MINFEKLLFMIEDVFYIIYDENHHILYPEDSDEKISSFFNLLISRGNVFYRKKDGTYWEKKVFLEEMDNKKYLIERYQDITRFKKRENDLCIDSVTHLFTRMIAMDMMKKNLQKAVQRKENFAVILGDIDFFKNINDTYGHACGDFVLEQVGKIFKQFLKTIPKKNKTIIGRFGGEEFAIFIKGMACEKLFQKIDNLRMQISKKVIKYKDKSIRITISFGIFHSDMKQLDDTSSIDAFFEEVYTMADQALYYAKECSRNCVKKYSELKIN